MNEEVKNEELIVPTSVEVVEGDFFQSKNQFEHAQRVAIMLSRSSIVPKEYKGNVGNCVIALEMAYRMKVSPIMVMQNLYVIMGNPSWSSKFLIASLNGCGKFSPIRYENSEANGGSTRAVCVDKETGKTLYGVWVSMDMAKAEGWIDKSGSKWKTIPELMRNYRAASFFANQYAPEISMGFPTTEEVYDIEANVHQEAKDRGTDALANVITAIDEKDKKATRAKSKTEGMQATMDLLTKEEETK